MPVITNKAPGPRVFNLKGAHPSVVLQRTLMPGESAEIELLVPINQDPVLKAMLEAGEIEEGGETQKSGAVDSNAVLEAEKKAAEAVAEVEKLRGELQAAEVDSARRTPPRMQGSDGGPQQSPTVDGFGGDKTPPQEEAGRPEPPPTEADKAVAERAASVAKAAEAEKKAEQPKPVSRSRG